MDPPDDLLLDSIAAAYRIGYDHGHAAGSMVVSIDAARAWLLDLADEHGHQAAALAQQTGPNWAQLIADQGDAP